MSHSDNPAQFFGDKHETDAAQYIDWAIRQQTAGYEIPGSPVSADATTIVGAA